MQKEKSASKQNKEKPLLYKLGIVLLILAVFCWIVAIIVPFTSLTFAVKSGIVTGGIIVGEILFWVGAIFVGREVVSKYKRYFNPKNWRRKRVEKEREQ